MASFLPPVAEHSQTLIYETFDHTNKTVYLEPILGKKRQGAITQRKIRKVCESCNGGWMRGIVDRSRSSVGNLIVDKPCRINVEAQKNIAAWVALAAVMAEFTDALTAAIPNFDRGSLMQTDEAPPNWTICLGRYNGTKFTYRHHGAKFILPSSIANAGTIESAEADFFQATTYALGPLLVHAYSSTSTVLIDWLRVSFAHPTLIQIWPRREGCVDWPCTPILGDDETAAIADAMYFRINSGRIPAF